MIGSQQESGIAARLGVAARQYIDLVEDILLAIGRHQIGKHGHEDVEQDDQQSESCSDRHLPEELFGSLGANMPAGIAEEIAQDGEADDSLHRPLEEQDVPGEIENVGPVDAGNPERKTERHQVRHVPEVDPDGITGPGNLLTGKTEYPATGKYSGNPGNEGQELHSLSPISDA